MKKKIIRRKSDQPKKTRACHDHRPMRDVQRRATKIFSPSSSKKMYTFGTLQLAKKWTKKSHARILHGLEEKKICILSIDKKNSTVPSQSLVEGGPEMEKIRDANAVWIFWLVQELVFAMMTINGSAAEGVEVGRTSSEEMVECWDRGQQVTDGLWRNFTYTYTCQQVSRETLNFVEMAVT